MTTTQDNQNRVIQLIKGNHIYCRSISPPQLDLTEKYVVAHTVVKHNVKKVKLYGKITLSGSNSIYLTMANIVKENNNNVNFIISDELYCDTPKIIKSFGCSVTEINVNHPNVIVEHFKKLDKTKTNVLFFESASNPNGNIFPFEILPTLRSLAGGKLWVVCDNTWLTHVILNPFQFPDIDVVVNSCSKYYSAGQCISGMIISKHNPFMSSLEILSKIMGNHISVDYCKILLSNFDSLYNRVLASHKNTVALTKVLKTYGFLNVRNSSDPSDPSNALANKYYNKDTNGETFCPSVINLTIKKPIEVLKKLLFENSITTQTSFGSSHTKVCNFIKSVSPDITELRISVGYDPIDLNMFSFLNNQTQMK